MLELLRKTIDEDYEDYKCTKAKQITKESSHNLTTSASNNVISNLIYTFYFGTLCIFTRYIKENMKIT